MHWKSSRTLIHLGLDTALVVAFFVSLRPFLTGLTVHEWLGLAVGAAVAVHMVLHHRWLGGVTKRLHKLPVRTRLYYIIDVSLAAALTTILLSGIAMSRVVLPWLGVTGQVGLVWYAVHKLSSYLTLLLVGIKLILHLKWFAAAIKKLGNLCMPATVDPDAQTSY